MKDKLVIGILAHVDAGKTTLAESILYKTGSIRKFGRVDHQDAFLDTYMLERSRGITIFAKQANFNIDEKEFTLLDTPGHVDFSAEMERTLAVLDYAILVINGADGVQGHTYVLWRLLERYDIPTFLFINKMDQQGTDKKELIKELKKELNENCIEFSNESGKEAFFENIAMCDERAIEEYIEHGTITSGRIKQLVAKRKVFPCYFGSALKIEGIEEFLKGIFEYSHFPNYPEQFGARIYKISRDDQGNRLTHMKVTGGTLKVKTTLQGNNWEEKTDQIRIYNGTAYKVVQEASAGSICAVTGLLSSKSGEGIGIEKNQVKPILEPVLSYHIILPDGTDVHNMYIKLKQLEEEEPELHITWEDKAGEIHAKAMGEIQIQILKSLIKERFNIDVEFGSGSIVYKETIKGAVEGVGHYEPLRHYAEVHFIMESLENGSGLQFASICSADELDINWQRLILTHLVERKHLGVLTGSEITDMKITLAAGKAHLKHTSGGDFRQAVYRAVRQALKKAESVLLEPVFEFKLKLPQEYIGRAMNDVQNMHGTFEAPEILGDNATLHGSAPVAKMQEYQKEVASYTRGYGRLSCILKGYEPCHNNEEIIAQIGYDPDTDIDNPSFSIFCSHGSSFNVEWDHVEEYMHLESVLKDKSKENEIDYHLGNEKKTTGSKSMGVLDKELEEIFVRTYGPSKRQIHNQVNKLDYNKDKPIDVKPVKEYIYQEPKKKEEYLLVDGYNIIFAWEDLSELAKTSMDGARIKLMDILSNYQGFRKITVILVFDAYKVKGFMGEVQKYENIYVVYTKEAETADNYIEKTVHDIGHKHNVTVATSDRLEQIIIYGQGARSISAMELKHEIEKTNEEIRRLLKGE